jgi:hypothetical protein
MTPSIGSSSVPYERALAGGLRLAATNSRLSPSAPDKAQPLSAAVFFSEKRGSASESNSGD